MDSPSKDFNNFVIKENLIKSFRYDKFSFIINLV